MSESTLPLSVSMDAEYSDRVNFSMQQNGVAVIDKLSITNNSEQPLEDLTVKVSLENEECEPWVGRIACITPGATYQVEPESLSLNAQFLAKRTEAQRTLLHVDVTCADSAASKTFPVDLLAFDHWPGVGYWPQMTAAFVTPNHPHIAELLKVARLSLGEISDHDALDGYQSQSRQRAAHIAEACFNAVATWGLGYINPPASFEDRGQRVRLVDRLHREQMGTCLDLALLMASLWEQCGLHPLILLPQNHAMPAFWTRETHLAQPVLDEPSQIRNLIALGEIIPVEATLLTKRGTRFIEAFEAAQKNMDKPGDTFTAIDIRTCRKLKIRPLPLCDDGGRISVDLSAIQPNPQLQSTSTTIDSLTLADRADEAYRQQSQNGGQGNSDEVETEDSLGRIERWQKRLLDLSLRNRLLNFRPSARTLEFSVPDVARLEDLLADQRALELLPHVEHDKTFLLEQLETGLLQSTEGYAEMNSRLLTLYRTARSSIEETGANLLHLAVGMLKWYESESSQVARYAPIILLPVQLKRYSSGSGYNYTVSLTDEPLRPNVTLLEKLRTEFGVSTEGLEGLPEDENGLDVPLILRNFRIAIRSSDRWEVAETVHLGLFSFNKFLMWRDLKDNLKQLKKNRLIGHIVDRPDKVFDTQPFPHADELDEKLKPGDLFCTRDADSTQLAAVQAAAMNKSFVLEGPPGTGKSQTIANIVADSLAHGKRVLFVAEKMAALGVVRKRLEDDGLGAFCLELHSSKATKKEVLTQLDTALNLEHMPSPAQWQQTCENLQLTRDQLNEYVKQLHATRETGQTLYQVLGRLSLLKQGRTIELPQSQIATATEKTLQNWRTAVANVVDTSLRVDPPAAHPLRGIGLNQWQFELPSTTRQAITRATQTISNLQQALEAYAHVAAFKLPLDLFTSQQVLAVSSFASLQRQLKQPIASIDLLLGPQAQTLQKQVQQAIETGKLRDQKQASLRERYHEEFLATDHLVPLKKLTQAKGQLAPLRLISNYLTRRSLGHFAKESIPSAEQLQADLEAALDVKRQTLALNNMPLVAQTLGALWNNGNADWALLEQMLESSVKLSRALQNLSQALPGDQLTALAQSATQSEKLASSQPAATALVQAWNTWSTAWEEMKTTLHTSSQEAFGSNVSGWLNVVKETFDRWLNGLGELDNWCAWRGARAAAQALELGELVEQYEKQLITHDEISNVFERSYGEQWFSHTANQIECIRSFNVHAQEKAIVNFGLLDQLLIQTTSSLISSRLAAQTPHATGQVSNQSEMGILRRELQKKSRHMPTRKLIECIPNLLARLKPCFLMSPLSIAQYLDAKLPPFDLVIFDEASQIPVWDAIGAIARGTEVIIVGDSKQLPPTSFFSIADDGYEDEDTQDLVTVDMESILKECNASGVPGMRLRWHYRSRHETLIAFSNHHYYDNKLHTFPSPDDRSDTLGVTLRHVPDGVYDRGGSRTNRIEARHVVDHVIKLLLLPDATGSIGIVTFNQTQQMLIDDLLDAARREHPQIERFFTQEVHEPVFVKNLENVQGDERDTIIFSVGYGPDQNGKPTMNFGPLNRDGGERRLNVAVTRARCRLIVFSSLRADQIDLRRSQALGVKHFKTFLDYADRGPLAIAQAMEISSQNVFDSNFEKAVWQALTERGWQVDTQVGCAGYRVDLGVRDPENPGSYMLGIECDGATYHSAKTARDRDRLRQSVLENLGWKIHRVWSTQWKINPDRCLDQIEQVLQSIKQGQGADFSQPIADTPEDSSAAKLTPADNPSPSQSSADSAATDTPDNAPLLAEDSSDQIKMAAAPAGHADESLQQASSPLPRQLPAYALAAVSKRNLSQLDIYGNRSFMHAVTALQEIITAEGPIVSELAQRRLAQCFNIQRMTARYRQQFARIEAQARQLYAIQLVDDVYWPADADPQSYALVRVPGDSDETKRDLEHVPLAERVNAVCHVVKEQFGLPQAELCREVARLLGAQRVTSKVAELLEQSIDAAIAANRIQKQGEHITIV